MQLPLDQRDARWIMLALITAGIVLVATSWVGIFPMCLLEAMALGKPVVTNQAPGTVDLVRHERNALVASRGDAESLAREANRLINDSSLARRLAQTALEDIQRHHTIDTHAAAKLETIRELWDRARGKNSEMTRGG